MQTGSSVQVWTGLDWVGFNPCSDVLLLNQLNFKLSWFFSTEAWLLLEKLQTIPTQWADWLGMSPTQIANLITTFFLYASP